MDIKIREVKVEDSEELYNIRQMPNVMENILSVKDEPKDFLKKRIENRGANDYWFVAEIDNKVVGLVTLMVHGNQRKSHVGYIAIMVNSDFHGKGVGYKLMDKVIDIADNELKLKRLELSAFKENERAINLYKKFGFEIEGTMRMSALRNGIYSDEYSMSRINEEV